MLQDWLYNTGGVNGDKEETQRKINGVLADIFSKKKFILTKEEMNYSSNLSMNIRKRMGCRIEKLPHEDIGWWEKMSRQYRRMHKDKMWTIVMAIGDKVSCKFFCLS
jgi:hypothetical protein